MRFAQQITLVLGLTFGLAMSAPVLAATGDVAPLKTPGWSFEGPLGHYDRGSLQRGFQVYKEVCSACHSLNRIAFHNLSQEGGPGFTDPQAKAIAAAYKIDAGPNDKGETTDDKGNPLKRPGILADHFPAPFANEEAARANNNGALPPDLSIIVKAREGGPDYVYSILTGFHQRPPAGFTVLANKYYNPYFAGWNISMPPPLTDGSVTYADGTKATVDQEARDVVTFLTWAGEPKMEERKQMGFGVMIFLVLLAGILFLAYRKVWADAH